MKNSENELLQFPVIWFWSFLEDPPYDHRYIHVCFREDGFQIECILPRKHGFSGGQPAWSLTLYTKWLSRCFCLALRYMYMYITAVCSEHSVQRVVSQVRSPSVKSVINLLCCFVYMFRSVYSSSTFTQICFTLDCTWFLVHVPSAFATSRCCTEGFGHGILSLHSTS